MLNMEHVRPLASNGWAWRAFQWRQAIDGGSPAGVSSSLTSPPDGRNEAQGPPCGGLAAGFLPSTK